MELDTLFKKDYPRFVLHLKLSSSFSKKNHQYAISSCGQFRTKSAPPIITNITPNQPRKYLSTVINARHSARHTIPTANGRPRKKPLKVRQNASKRIPPLHPAAPILMRFRPWRKFESKEPYIAGRCGGGTTARAGPKRAFFLLPRQYHSSGREKAASWAACAVAGALRRDWAVAAPSCPLSRRGGHPGRPARALAACSLS